MWAFRWLDGRVDPVYFAATINAARVMWKGHKAGEVIPVTVTYDDGRPAKKARKK
jgi:hypothetical protein